MSNFQRTRSKVWWGDSPPNIGSPVAQQPEWNKTNRPRDEPDWEPQLPHWIANQPEQQRNNSTDNIAHANNVQINQWPLRHGSPGSHKSQDSGFSDSDSSPPPSQYYPSPENSSKNKSSSSSDSNNNENVTVKHVIELHDTPKSIDVVDNTRMPDNGSFVIPTPKPRLRSSSVIQTPYDLQKYYEIHHDEEHMELLKIKDTEEISKREPKYPSPRNINNEKSNIDKISKNVIPKTVTPKSNNRSVNKIEIKVTPPNNISNKENTPNKSAIQRDTKDIPAKNLNIISPSKKYPVKKAFVSSTESDSTKVSKVAKVKDLETSKNKSDENLEYIKLSDNNEIAVNNQPRIRTPISNVSYVPTERTPTSKETYRRSISIEDNIPISTTPKFERNRLNKSLNFEAQRLDQQILDIQDGYHSLGYIDEDGFPPIEPECEKELIHKPAKALLGKNIMDSLNLKPTKKVGPKAKHRMATKSEKAKELFRIFPTKKEKPGVVETHAGGVLRGSRVPSLGLPRVSEQNSWVVVGYPEKELLIPNYNERLVATDSDIDMQAKDNLEDDVNHFKNRRVTPPPQFQDKDKTPYETDSKSDKDLTHDSKREKLKDDVVNFVDVQLNMACTSTPKMLAPHEFMDIVTPKSHTKNSLRVNLLDNFNGGVVLNNRDEILYRERSIDQTTLERLCERKPESVQHWLCDLAGSCENECMTTLQSKPLGAEMKAMVSASSATITGNIKKVQTHGQIIVHQYSDVIRQIESHKINEEQICLLVANVNEFVLAHSITLNTKPPGETPERWDKIKKSLQVYLQKLIDIGEDVKVELNESNPELSLVQKHLDTLIGIFLETTKAVLVQQMKTLVSIIEEPPSDMILKSTLTSIGHLAMLSDNTESSLHEKCAKIMKSITELPFVDCGVPRALLTAIIESNKSSIKALSLRALATVCVTSDAVKQFEEGGGIEILSDILSDRSNPEPQMREAITVLTQITAPWLRGHYDIAQLHLYLNTIVDNITGILSRTNCCQLLLLCTACLVNLVRELELEKRDGDDNSTRSDIVEVFTKHRTVERLLEAVKKRGPSISVFLQEQTASLVASLSRVPRCVLPLSRVPAASVALVCFTRGRPPAAAAASTPARPAELRAQARLHCHAAEAISRLSVVPEVAQQIVQLEGVPHLIRLVRMQRTRPHLDHNPDQTLIHCLKALRVIYRHCPEAFEDYQKDVDDMIRPHLMESLMMFSAKQESYV